MKPQRRSCLACIRAQFAADLRAYSAASIAAFGTASVAALLAATPTVSALPPGYHPIDASYFDGTLPELSFSLTDNANFLSGAYTAFELGGESLRFIGGHQYSDASNFRGDLGLFQSLPNLQLAINGEPLGSSAFIWLFSTSAGSIGTNAFSHLGSVINSHYANLSFATAGGIYGRLNLHLGFDGAGNMSLSVASTGSYYVASVPEPASIATGLGLLALGYVGIREHRRRAKAKAAPAI